VLLIRTSVKIESLLLSLKQNWYILWVQANIEVWRWWSERIVRNNWRNSWWGICDTRPIIKRDWNRQTYCWTTYTVEEKSNRSNGQWLFRFRNSMKHVQALPETDTDYGHKLWIPKICTRFKKIIRFQKWKSRWDLEKLYAQSKKVQNNLEEKLTATECEVGMWKSSYQEMCVKFCKWFGWQRQQESKKAIYNRRNGNMDEGKNVNNEGRKNYRKLKMDWKEPQMMILGITYA